MARDRKRAETEPEEDDDDEETEEEDEAEAAEERDYIMARLAAASVSLKASLSAVDDMLALYVNPDDDKKGKERTSLLETALETAGCATRALECAAEIQSEVDADVFEEREPWEEEE